MDELPNPAIDIERQVCHDCAALSLLPVPCQHELVRESEVESEGSLATTESVATVLPA